MASSSGVAPFYVPLEIARLICREIYPRHDHLGAGHASLPPVELQSIRYLLREFARAGAERLFECINVSFTYRDRLYPAPLVDIETWLQQLCSTGLNSLVRSVDMTASDLHPGGLYTGRADKRLPRIYGTRPRDLLQELRNVRRMKLTILHDRPGTQIVSSDLSPLLDTILPRLQELDLIAMRGQVHWLASLIEQHCQQSLRRLSLSVVPPTAFLYNRLESESVKKTARIHVPWLTELTLKGAIQDISLEAPFVKRLTLRDPSRVPNADLITRYRTLLEWFELKQLWLDSAESDAYLAALSLCSRLTHLSMSGTTVQPTHSGPSRGFDRLRTLDLDKRCSVPAEVLERIITSSKATLEHVRFDIVQLLARDTNGNVVRESDLDLLFPFSKSSTGWVPIFEAMLRCTHLKSLFLRISEYHETALGHEDITRYALDRARATKAEPRGVALLRLAGMDIKDRKAFFRLGELVRMVRNRRMDWGFDYGSFEGRGNDRAQEEMVLFAPYFASLFPWQAIVSGEATEDDVYEWSPNQNVPSSETA